VIGFQVDGVQFPCPEIIQVLIGYLKLTGDLDGDGFGVVPEVVKNKDTETGHIQVYLATLFEHEGGQDIRSGQAVQRNTLMDELQVDIEILKLVIQAIEDPESSLIGGTDQPGLINSQFVKPDRTPDLRKEIIHPYQLVVVFVIQEDAEWISYVDGMDVSQKEIGIFSGPFIILCKLDQPVVIDDIYIPQGV
jgi:hypothetical protein